MTRIVAIKFCQAGRHYHFLAGDLEMEPGDTVVVETVRGQTLGTVATAPEEVSEEILSNEIQSVVRKATQEDVDSQEYFRSREKSAFDFCCGRIEERKMEMKLVRTEYLFDGSKIIFYFTADGRIDFRELVKDLAHQFHTRIEMKQIGVRDESKMVGGLGICGRELCCRSFLREFSPVSVKMAKEQGLALNPAKISGQCGRLLCCLSYEFGTYTELKKGFPKHGSKTTFNDVPATVTDVNCLSGKITLKTEDGQNLTVSMEEFNEKHSRLSRPQAEEKHQNDAPSKPANASAPQPPRGHRPIVPRERRGNIAPAGNGGENTKEKEREIRHPERGKTPGKPVARKRPDTTVIKGAEPSQEKSALIRRRMRRGPAAKSGGNHPRSGGPQPSSN